MTLPDYTKVTKLMEGMYFWRNPNGIAVCMVHYSSDPDKRKPEWIALKKQGMSESQWAKEMELDFSVEGEFKSIFGRVFNREVNVGNVSFDPNYPVILGWDFGTDRPAVVFLQIDDNGQVRVLNEILGDNVLLRQFALTQILPFRQKHYPNARYEHYCDVAGIQRSGSGTAEYTAIELLNNLFPNEEFVCQTKWNVKQGIYLIEAKLSQRINNEAGIVISPHCPILIEGLAGGYKWDKAGLKPMPSIFNHLIDALRYVLCYKFTIEQTKNIVTPVEEKKPLSREEIIRNIVERKPTTTDDIDAPPDFFD